jgi:hypothetical protein
MAALMTNGLSSENAAIGLPPGLANPPGLSAPPGLEFESQMDGAKEDSEGEQLPPSNHFANLTLSAENARLALENELLKRECAQKQMVEAMYGRAAYEMNMRAVAAGAFPNPWYQMPMTGATPRLVGSSFHDMSAPMTRPRTCSDISSFQFSTPRGRERAPSELSKVAETPMRGRERSATDGHILTKSQHEGPHHTLMLRNLPNNYTRIMLISLLDNEGFGGQYDFVYLPIDFKSHASLGYAFVNLSTTEAAERCWKVFEGFNKWVVPSSKVCSVNWSTPFQGLDAHVERYRNSPVMHEHVPDEYKPMLLSDGKRLPFPPPTKKIRAPRIRPGRDELEGCESGSGNEQ